MTDPRMLYVPQDYGRTRVELTINDECVSRLTIVPFNIRVGAAQIRMDGISSVRTADEHRKKGYCSRVMDAAIERMTTAGTAITMLYGIRDFYEKFGYATSGPNYLVMLRDVTKGCHLPDGWTARPITSDDLPAARDVYDRATSCATGAAVRSESDLSWSQILNPERPAEENECRVIVGPDGLIHAYAWLARWHNHLKQVEDAFPDCLVFGEVIADSPQSADAVLCVCRLMAQERAQERVLLMAPHDGWVGMAAMSQDARLMCEYQSSGMSMVRVIDVRRLLKSLRPEIEARLQRSRFEGSLTIRTDIGDVAIVVGPDGVRVGDASEGLAISMPQTALGRLALGSFPPEDILARLPEPPDPAAAELVQTIFPMRCQHMYIPDRY